MMDDVIFTTILFLLVLLGAVVFAWEFRLFALARHLGDVIWRRLTFQPFEAQAQGLPCTFAVVAPMFFENLGLTLVLLCAVLALVFMVYMPATWMIAAWAVL